MRIRTTFIGFALAAVVFSLIIRERDDAVVAMSLQANQQDELALALRDPGRHYRLALPEFTVGTPDAPLSAAARTIAEVLWNDINFEREFYMIPRVDAARVPVAAAEALPYQQWAELDADFVLVGAVRRTGTDLTLELRMVSVKAENRGKPYFAMGYTCKEQNPRFCAHSIADDFHKQARNLDGVARTKLAFSSDRDSSRVAGRPSQTEGQGKEIYVADYDGAGQLRLTVNRSLNINPSWATSSLLSYTSYSSGFPDIYLANLATPGRLTRPAAGNDRVQNQLGAWSPDGSKLAYMSNETGDMDIWIVNRDGSGRQNLTSFPKADEGSPTWSPDGSQIAFTSTRATGQTPQLYVMNSAGTAQRRLLDVRVDRPTWSQQKFIAFTVGGGPGHDIGIYDFNSPGGVRVITDGQGSNESPAVAPNGRHIAFFTTRWGKQQIAIIDSDGKNIRQITNSGNNMYPSWQPIAR
ncbi:MAG: hypothetical protein ABI051_07015 [Vicinamibacterales bacterium]